MRAYVSSAVRRTVVRLCCNGRPAQSTQQLFGRAGANGRLHRPRHHQHGVAGVCSHPLHLLERAVQTGLQQGGSVVLVANSDLLTTLAKGSMWALRKSSYSAVACDTGVASGNVTRMILV